MLEILKAVLQECYQHYLNDGASSKGAMFYLKRDVKRTLKEVKNINRQHKIFN